MPEKNVNWYCKLVQTNLRKNKINRSRHNCRRETGRLSLINKPGTVWTANPKGYKMDKARPKSRPHSATHKLRANPMPNLVPTRSSSLGQSKPQYFNKRPKSGTLERGGNAKLPDRDEDDGLVPPGVLPSSNAQILTTSAMSPPQSESTSSDQSGGYRRNGSSQQYPPSNYPTSRNGQENDYSVAGSYQSGDGQVGMNETSGAMVSA